MTEEQKKISGRNRKIRRKEFGIDGNPNLVMHHKDINMRHENVDRYIQWLPEDLVILTKSQHSQLHSPLIDKKLISDGVKRAIAAGKISRRGRHWKVADTSNYKGQNSKGKHWKLSDEAKANHSESMKKHYANHAGNAAGKHWYNDGIKETYAIECPDGFVKGRLKRYAELNRK